MTTNHSAETIGPDEPEGGWQQAPTLADSQILSIALCRFTGERPEDDNSCYARATHLHRDEDCITLYHQAEALAAGTIRFDMPATEITQSAAGDDLTYQQPL